MVNFRKSQCSTTGAAQRHLCPLKADNPPSRVNWKKAQRRSKGRLYGATILGLYKGIATLLWDVDLVPIPVLEDMKMKGTKENIAPSGGIGSMLERAEVMEACSFLCLFFLPLPLISPPFSVFSKLCDDDE